VDWILQAAFLPLDELMRLIVTIQFKAIDDATPDDPGILLQAEIRAASLSRPKRTESIVEVDYDINQADGHAGVKRAGSCRAQASVSKVWERGHILLPQLLKPFVKDKSLLELVGQHSKLLEGKTLVECADGAPMSSLFKLSRAALYANRSINSTGNGDCAPEDKGNVLHVLGVEDLRKEECSFQSDSDSTDSEL
jgi:hypothetical protein